MINILMNKKRGLNRFSKLPDDGDPWAPNNVCIIYSHFVKLLSEVDKKIHSIAARDNTAPLRLEGVGLTEKNVTGMSDVHGIVMHRPLKWT